MNRPATPANDDAGSRLDLRDVKNGSIVLDVQVETFFLPLALPSSLLLFSLLLGRVEQENQRLLHTHPLRVSHTGYSVVREGKLHLWRMRAT